MTYPKHAVDNMIKAIKAEKRGKDILKDFEKDCQYQEVNHLAGSKRSLSEQLADLKQSADLLHPHIDDYPEKQNKFVSFMEALRFRKNK